MTLDPQVVYLFVLTKAQYEEGQGLKTAQGDAFVFDDFYHSLIRKAQQKLEKEQTVK